MSGLFLRQRRTTDLPSLGGLYRTHPAVAVLAMVPIFSLAGVPPLSGFIAKLGIVDGRTRGAALLGGGGGSRRESADAAVDGARVG